MSDESVAEGVDDDATTGGDDGHQGTGMHGEAVLTPLETALARLETTLDRVRADERTRWGATAVAVVLGLGLAALHWVGLVAGGALVALPRKRARYAPLAGLGFGVAALVAFVLATPGASVGELLALAPPIYVALGAGLVLPVLGSLVRGIV